MTQSRIDKALEVAAIVHEGQARKGTDIPYIIHPVGVMLGASKVTGDEDTLVACLLHDVLEDGDPDVYSVDDMLRDFGPKVTAIVKAVTKDESISDWRTRNEDYLRNLAKCQNRASYIVSAADKIHNLRSILVDHEQVGEVLWSRFNAGKDAQKWWYHATLALFEEKIPGNPLARELAELVTLLDKL